MFLADSLCSGYQRSQRHPLRSLIPGLVGFGLLAPLVSFANASSALDKPAPTHSVDIHQSNVVIEIPIYESVSHRQLVAQAEALVSDRIRQAFQQDRRISSIKVTVLGNQHGNVIPLLTTAVARAQWQKSPDVQRWTRYDNSYALLQRPAQAKPRTVVAARPIAAVPAAPMPRENLARMEAAFDLGNLSGRVVQGHLSHWD